MHNLAVPAPVGELEPFTARRGNRGIRIILTAQSSPGANFEPDGERIQTGQNVTIVQMNETHGYLEPYRKLFLASNGAGFRMAGGFARLATLLDRFRQGRDGQALAFNGGQSVL
jgi:2',3'-cyclic-nucleotide 2'-phosphodiesterase (5'-nucleotidase family)